MVPTAHRLPFEFFTSSQAENTLASMLQFCVHVFFLLGTQHYIEALDMMCKILHGRIELMKAPIGKSQNRALGFWSMVMPSTVPLGETALGMLLSPVNDRMFAHALLSHEQAFYLQQGSVTCHGIWTQKGLSQQYYLDNNVKCLLHRHEDAIHHSICPGPTSQKRGAG